MVILTVKFPKGTKTYDYLMVNPRKYRLDKSAPIKIITGTSGSGLRYNEAQVVSGFKTDKLPPHVTAQMTILAGNFVSTGKVTAVAPDPAEIKSKPAVATPEEEESAPESPALLTKEYYISQHGRWMWEWLSPKLKKMYEDNSRKKKEEMTHV